MYVITFSYKHHLRPRASSLIGRETFLFTEDRWLRRDCLWLRSRRSLRALRWDASWISYGFYVVSYENSNLLIRKMIAYQRVFG